MQLLTMNQRRKRGVTSLVFAPDGRALVAMSPRANPTLWELPITGAPVEMLGSPSTFSQAFVFSPDALIVGWISGQTRIEFHRRTGGTVPGKLTPDGEIPDAQTVCGPDGRLVVRTAERGAGYRLRGFVPNGTGWAEAWTVGPVDDLGGSMRIAGAARADLFFNWEVPPYNSGKPRRLVVRSATTGEIVAETTPQFHSLYGLTATPDGSVVVGYRDSWLCAWRPGEKVEKVRTGTLKHYRGLAFHPDGRHLLAGNNDTTARVIDTQTWQIVRQYVWNIGSLTAVAVSPDGALAAAGGEKGRIVVWDLDL